MRLLLIGLTQLALAVGCVLLARRYFDAPQVLAGLAQASLLQLTVAVAGQCVVAWPLSLMRLMALCRRFPVSWSSGFLVLSLGQIMNALLPMKLGEAPRLALLARTLGNDLTQATEITFWERFGDLNALLIVLLLAGPTLGGTALAVPVGGLAVGFWAAVLALKAWGGPIHKLLARLPWPRLGAYLVGVAGAIRVRLTPGFALGLGLLSLLPWMGQVLVQHYILCDVFLMRLSPLEVLAVVSAGIAGQAVPATPGGIGLYEGAVVATLALFGQPMEQALAAALTMHAVMLLPSFLGGVWAASRLGAQAALRLAR